MVLSLFEKWYKNTTYLNKCSNLEPSFLGTKGKMKAEIEKIITEKGGFIRRNEVPRRIFRQFYELVDKGELVRVKRGVYSLPISMANTMYDIERIVPGGILCSYSAWDYYNLTTQIPYGIFVAIPRGKRIRLPDYPPITLLSVSTDIFEIGLTTTQVGGYTCRIYDIERSVCDAIKFRNKIGIDVCAEIVNNYLRRPDRNIFLLTRYAKILRVGATLSKYLEISL